MKSFGGVNSITHHHDPVQQFSYCMGTWVKRGNYKEARFILSKIWSQTNYGYNELHYNVLLDYKPGEKIKDFKTVSVAKKGHTCHNATPLHFACINPNSEVLKQLLEVNGDIHLMD